MPYVGNALMTHLLDRSEWAPDPDVMIRLREEAKKFQSQARDAQSVFKNWEKKLKFLLIS